MPSAQHQNDPPDSSRRPRSDMGLAALKVLLRPPRRYATSRRGSRGASLAFCGAGTVWLSLAFGLTANASGIVPANALDLEWHRSYDLQEVQKIERLVGVMHRETAFPHADFVSASIPNASSVEFDTIIIPNWLTTTKHMEVYLVDTADPSDWRIVHQITVSYLPEIERRDTGFYLTASVLEGYSDGVGVCTVKRFRAHARRLDKISSAPCSDFGQKRYCEVDGMCAK